jgi:oligopeptidase B
LFKFFFGKEKSNLFTGAFVAASALLSHSSLYSGALLEVPFLNAFEELSNPVNSVSKFEADEWGDIDLLRELDPTEMITSPSRHFTLPPMMLTCSDSDSRVSASSVKRFAHHAREQGNDVRVLDILGGHGGDGGAISWANNAAEMLDFLTSLQCTASLKTIKT